jgi:hypothetical protein
MISSAHSQAREPLLLSAEKGAQPSAGECVEPFEDGVMGVLEVAEPADERPVEVLDDAREAVAARAFRLGPDRVFELYQALLAHVALAGFEPVAEELETLSNAHPPSCLPSLGRVYAAPPSRGPPFLAQSPRRYEGSHSCPARTRRTGLFAYLPCLPNIPPPTASWARASLSQSSQRARWVLRPEASLVVLWKFKELRPGIFGDGQRAAFPSFRARVGAAAQRRTPSSPGCQRAERDYRHISVNRKEELVAAHFRGSAPRSPASGRCAARGAESVSMISLRRLRPRVLGGRAETFRFLAAERL